MLLSRLRSSFNKSWVSLISTVILSPLRVSYSLMKNADKDVDEAPLYRMEILERQLALVELPVDEYLFYDALHVGLYTLRGRVIQCPRCCLHRIGEHHDPGFLCLWLRS